MTDRLLTIDETAELGRVSTRTVRREIQRGNLQAVRISRQIVRVPEAAARRWAGLAPTSPFADYRGEPQPDDRR